MVRSTYSLIYCLLVLDNQIGWSEWHFKVVCNPESQEGSEINGNANHAPGNHCLIHDTCLPSLAWQGW